MSDKIFADAENNVFGNAGKCPSLNDVKNACDDLSIKLESNNRDIKNGKMPFCRKQSIYEPDC